MSIQDLSPVRTYHTKSYGDIHPTRPQVSAQGKVVVITGGGSGIGQAAAMAFATAGASKIAILGRTESSLQLTKKAIVEEHPVCDVLTIATDLVDTAAVTTAFQKIRSTLGSINVLVNNSGYINTLSLIADAVIEDWWRCFEVNVKGSINVLKAFLSENTASPHASVINVSTASMHTILAGQTPYGSSKLAAVRLFEVLQLEQPQMQVISVHPGKVRTAMGLKPSTSGQNTSSVPWDEGQQLVFPPRQYQYMMPEAATNWVLTIVELSAGFIVWAASPEAQFLKGRFVWANWDIGQLKDMENDLQGSDKFTTGLYGCRKVVFNSWQPPSRVA